MAAGATLVFGTYRRWPWFTDPKSDEGLFSFWSIGAVLGRVFLLGFNYVLGLGLGAGAIAIALGCW